MKVRLSLNFWAAAANTVSKGAVIRSEFGRAAIWKSSFCSRRGGGSPRLERFFSEDAERAAGGEMAFGVEGVLDSGVNGQEALGGSG